MIFVGIHSSLRHFKTSNAALMAALAYLSLIFHVELDQLGQGRELLASVQVVEVAGVLENASSVAQIILV